jgi:hypothetical protein
LQSFGKLYRILRKLQLETNAAAKYLSYNDKRPTWQKFSAQNVTIDGLHIDSRMFSFAEFTTVWNVIIDEQIHREAQGQEYFQRVPEEFYVSCKNHATHDRIKKLYQEIQDVLIVPNRENQCRVVHKQNTDDVSLLAELDAMFFPADSTMEARKPFQPWSQVHSLCQMYDCILEECRHFIGCQTTEEGTEVLTEATELEREKKWLPVPSALDEGNKWYKPYEMFVGNVLGLEKDSPQPDIPALDHLADVEKLREVYEIGTTVKKLEVTAKKWLKKLDDSWNSKPGSDSIICPDAHSEEEYQALLADIEAREAAIAPVIKQAPVATDAANAASRKRAPEEDDVDHRPSQRPRTAEVVQADGAKPITPLNGLVVDQDKQTDVGLDGVLAVKATAPEHDVVALGEGKKNVETVTAPIGFVALQDTMIDQDILNEDWYRLPVSIEFVTSKEVVDDQPVALTTKPPSDEAGRKSGQNEGDAPLDVKILQNTAAVAITNEDEVDRTGGGRSGDDSMMSDESALFSEARSGDSSPTSSVDSDMLKPLEAKPNSQVKVSRHAFDESLSTLCGRKRGREEDEEALDTEQDSRSAKRQGNIKTPIRVTQTLNRNAALELGQPLLARGGVGLMVSETVDIDATSPIVSNKRDMEDDGGHELAPQPVKRSRDDYEPVAESESQPRDAKRPRKTLVRPSKLISSQNVLTSNAESRKDRDKNGYETKDQRPKTDHRAEQKLGQATTTTEQRQSGLVNDGASNAPEQPHLSITNHKDTSKKHSTVCGRAEGGHEDSGHLSGDVENSGHRPESKSRTDAAQSKPSRTLKPENAIEYHDQIAVESSSTAKAVDSVADKVTSQLRGLLRGSRLKENPADTFEYLQWRNLIAALPRLQRSAWSITLCGEVARRGFCSPKKERA